MTAKAPLTPLARLRLLGADPEAVDYADLRARFTVTMPLSLADEIAAILAEREKEQSRGRGRPPKIARLAERIADAVENGFGLDEAMAVAVKYLPPGGDAGKKARSLRTTVSRLLDERGVKPEDRKARERKRPPPQGGWG
jgi:hypothetical protein